MSLLAVVAVTCPITFARAWQRILPVVEGNCRLFNINLQEYTMDRRGDDRRQRGDPRDHRVRYGMPFLTYSMRNMLTSSQSASAPTPQTQGAASAPVHHSAASATTIDGATDLLFVGHHEATVQAASGTTAEGATVSRRRHPAARTTSLVLLARPLLRSRALRCRIAPTTPRSGSRHKS